MFEHPDDLGKLFRRRHETVDCEKLANLIKDRRVPLFFLEACQSAHAETDPTSSVAGTLLQGGAASVAAMSHTVLVETARRFVGPFYQALLQGERVGQAMLAGQKALHDDSNRGRGFGGELRLQDWFVPVLFQEETDPQLVRQVPAQRVQEEIEKQRRLAVGKVPEPPPHSFVGRSRELLAAERLLLGTVQEARRRFVVIRGEGGEGKTAPACELRGGWPPASGSSGRPLRAWRTAPGRDLALDARRAARAPVRGQAGADDKREWQLVERALRDQPTLLVIDNVESVLPPYGWAAGSGAEGPRVSIRISWTRSWSYAESWWRRAGPDWSSPRGRRCPRLSTTGAASSMSADSRRARRSSWWATCWAKAAGSRACAPTWRAASRSRSWSRRWAATPAAWCWSPVSCARARLDDTTADIRQIMAHLHRRFPNDREQSLFASVELSLRKLPPDLRASCRRWVCSTAGGMS